MMQDQAAAGLQPSAGWQGETEGLFPTPGACLHPAEVDAALPQRVGDDAKGDRPPDAAGAGGVAERGGGGVLPEQ